jgi:general secretion pathway protein H
MKSLYLKSAQDISLQRPMRGFTLLEVLVVVVIIAVLITFVSLSLGNNQHKVLEQEAQRLYALLKLTAHESISNTAEMGVYLGEDHYQFYRLYQGQWQVLDKDDVLSSHQLPDFIQLDVNVEGVDLPADVSVTDFINDNPQVLFFTDGELTPFNCILSLKSDRRVMYNIEGLLNGQLNLELNSQGSPL